MGCAASTANVVEQMQTKAGDAKHAANKAMQTRQERKHDEKLLGVDVDAKLVITKEKLRGLRDTIDSASEVYRKWCSHTTDGLLLPSLSVLARRLDWVGGDALATRLHNVAAHCAELTKIQVQARSQFGKLVQAEFLSAKKEVQVALESLLAYENAAIAAKSLEDDSKKPKPKVATTPDALAEANSKVAELQMIAAENAAAAATAAEAKVAEAFRLTMVGYEKVVDLSSELLDDPSVGNLFQAYQPKYATTTASAAIGGVKLTTGLAHKSTTDEGQEVNAAIMWAQESIRNCNLAKKQLSTFAQKGLATLFGPRNEEEVLDALKVALSGAAVKGAAPKPSSAFAEMSATFVKEKLLPVSNALDAYTSALEKGVILAGKEYNKAVKDLAAAKKSEDTSLLEKLVAEKASATRAEVAKVDVATALVKPLEAFMEAFAALLKLRGSTGTYAKYKADYIAKHGAEVETTVELEADATFPTGDAM